MAWMSRRKGAQGGCRGFDTRPAAVRRWVTSLPLGDLDETGRRLARTIAEVNGRALPLKELHHFLEATGPAVTLAIEHLETRCRLRETSSDAARPTPLVAVELAAGYLRACGGLLRRGASSSWPWERWLERRRHAMALHRIFHYSERLLWLHRSLHSELPAGFWRRLHHCYRLAEGRGLCAIRCTSPDGKGGATTTAGAYHRLLLVAMLPATLTPPWQARVRAGLDGWAALVALKPSGDTPAPLRHAVDLERDCGPTRLVADASTGVGGGVRGVDTTALATRLTAFDGDEDDPGLRALLHDCWCVGRERSEPRKRERLRVEVVVGLDALSACAGGRVEAQPASFTRGGDLAQVTEEAGRGRAATREGEPSMHGELVDRSDSGASLVLYDVARKSVAPGMALGVRVDGGDWRVGVITRVKLRGRVTELGAQLHFSGLLPARLRAADSEEKGAWFHAVLGRSEKRWALAGPALATVSRGDALLEVAGRVVRVRRERSVCLSGHTEIFVFGAAGSEPLVPGRAPVPVSSATPPAVKKPSEPPDRESRISELMARTGLARDDAAFVADMELASA